MRDIELPGSTGIRFAARLQERHQVVKVFGASGAWWATGIGNRPSIQTILELLYTDKGIGLNNYRHNIGGGRAGGPRADDKSGPDAWRAVPCPLQAEGTLALAADAPAWEVLKRLVALGTVEDFTVFMNSPPESMTINGKTYGSGNGCNLREDCYEAYAAFCADVTAAYIAAGVPVKYISPFNEPQSQWEAGWQEGCYFSMEQIFYISRLLVEKLRERQLPTKISINESAALNREDYVFDFYRKLLADDTLYPYIDHFAGHSYHTSAEDKCRLYRYIQDTAHALGKAPLPINQTEWAAWHQYETLDDERRLVMTGRVLYEDLTLLNVETWEYFAAVARGQDALIVVKDQDPDWFMTTRHFWALGNYSKFIKGYTRVGVDAPDAPEGVLASAYLSPDERQLVFVLVNETVHKQAVILEGMRPEQRGVAYETSMQRTCDTPCAQIDGDGFYTLSSRSVTTVVFSM